MTDEPKKEMVVTPWEVSGDIDYDKLIDQFGVQRMTKEMTGGSRNTRRETK